MSPALGVIIMMNNYFHDVATALLLASGVVMVIITRKLGEAREFEVARYFLRIYDGVTKLAKFSLVWILIGGVPRVLTYREFEWANAVGRNQVPALIVKHVLFFIFVSAGAWVWIKLGRSVREIRTVLGKAGEKP